MASGALTGIGIVLVFALFRVFFPSNEPDFRPEISMEEMRRKYRASNFYALLAMLLLLPPITYLIYRLLYWAAQLRFSWWSGYEILIPPQKELWMLAAMFLAFIAFFHLTNWGSRLLLKEDFLEYKYYYNSLYGFDGWKAMKWLNELLLLLAIFVIGQGIHYCTVFRSDRMEYHTFFCVKKHEYTYGEIRQIARVQSFGAPNGDVKPYPHYAVIFNDGEVWNSRISGYSDEASDSQLMNFLLKKTGKTMVHLEFLEEN